MACNFGFAFDNPKFSDRILSIEIIPNPDEVQSDDTDSDLVTVIKQENAGDEATKRHDADRSRDFSTVLRVKTVHINSAILAEKSPFFYKLFSDGMRESEQISTLRIYDNEEASLMELLNFMYNNTLSTTSPFSLVGILMAADTFEVTSCMRYCSQELSKLPMTCDSALAYLTLPSCVSHADALQQLTDSAKQFIAVQFRDISKSYNEILSLPMAGIEAVLSSDDIQVLREDDVYDIVLKWAELHYPQLEERREILETSLRQLIRFPYMTNWKLQEVTTDANFSPGVASVLVLEALFFKNSSPYIQRQLALGTHAAGETSVNTDRRFVERQYLMRPVKVVEFELPRPRCVAYLNLKREDCARLFPLGWYVSEAFHIGTQGFFLMAHCTMDGANISQCFGLVLGMQEIGSANFSVDFEFAACLEEEYKTQCRCSYTFTPERTIVGCRNLFSTTWAAFIADDSPFFINGILHLRAVVTVK